MMNVNQGLRVSCTSSFIGSTSYNINPLPMPLIVNIPNIMPILMLERCFGGGALLGERSVI